MMTIVQRNALRQATGIALYDHNPARSTYREEKTVQTMGSTAYDGGDLVIPIQKTYNPISGKLATTQWYVGGLVFHMSPLLDFIVVGLAEAKHSGTLPTGVLKLSRKATFAGEGEILAGEAVFVGKVSVKGSMLVP